MKAKKTHKISIVLCIFIALTSFGLSLLYIASNTVEMMSNRLGSDLIIVPSGYSIESRDLLLEGTKNRLYLKSSDIDLIKKIKGIKYVSPQTYVTTIKKFCCSIPINFVSIDYNNDFLVKSWLKDYSNLKLKDNDIIVGNDVNANIGDKLEAFDKKFNVVAKLDKTGMSVDSNIYTNYKFVDTMVKKYEKLRNTQLVNDYRNPSYILVKLEKGQNVKKIANDINKKYAKNGIFAIRSKNLINNISNKLNLVNDIIKLASLILGLLGIILISLISMREINKERDLKVKDLLSKYFNISIKSTFIGILISLIALILFIYVLKEFIGFALIKHSLNSIFNIYIVTTIIGIFLNISIIQIKKIKESN